MKTTFYTNDILIRNFVENLLVQSFLAPNVNQFDALARMHDFQNVDGHSNL